LTKLSDKPALLLWGSADTGFKDSERVRFEAALPRHHTRILDGAKHFIQENDPAAICSEIRAFEQDPPAPRADVPPAAFIHPVRPTTTPGVALLADPRRRPYRSSTPDHTEPIHLLNQRRRMC
jgi:hypothetical protein